METKLSTGYLVISLSWEELCQSKLALGISKLVYQVPVLTMPEKVIKRFQEKLLHFLWRNKKILNKEGGAVSKAKQRWPRLPKLQHDSESASVELDKQSANTNDTWKAIPNAFFNKYGGLAFLLKCNYDTKYVDRHVSSFYQEMLHYSENCVVTSMINTIVTLFC